MGLRHRHCRPIPNKDDVRRIEAFEMWLMIENDKGELD